MGIDVCFRFHPSYTHEPTNADPCVEPVRADTMIDMQAVAYLTEPLMLS